MHGTWNQKQKKTPTHDAFLEKDLTVLFVHKTTTTHKKQQLAFSPMKMMIRLLVILFLVDKPYRQTHIREGRNKFLSMAT